LRREGRGAVGVVVVRGGREEVEEWRQQQYDY